MVICTYSISDLNWIKNVEYFISLYKPYFLTYFHFIIWFRVLNPCYTNINLFYIRIIFCDPKLLFMSNNRKWWNKPVLTTYILCVEISLSLFLFIWRNINGYEFRIASQILDNIHKFLPVPRHVTVMSKIHVTGQSNTPVYQLYNFLFRSLGFWMYPRLAIIIFRWV